MLRSLRTVFPGLLFFILYLGVSGIPFAFSQEASVHTGYFSHGVALAYMILYGPIAAPGVFIAQLGISLFTGVAFPHALVLAEVYTLTSLGEALVFKRLNCSSALTGHRDTLILLVLIIFIFQPVAVLAAHMLTGSPADGLNYAWLFKAWLGNSNGQMLMAPFILLVYHWWPSARKDWKTWRTALLWSVAACLFTVILFFAAGSLIPKGYKVLTLSMLFPFFILLSLRYNFLVVGSALLSGSMAAFFMPLHDSVLSISPLFPYRDQVHFFLLCLSVTAILVVSFSESERRMRASLISSEHKFRMLFQNMSQAFVFGKVRTNASGVPVDFTIILINDLFADLIGHKNGDAVGRNLSELLPSAGDEVLAKFWTVASTGVPFQREYFSPVFNKHINVIAYSPEPDHIGVLVEDITERVDAQNLLKSREREFSSAFHGSNIGVGIVDLEGNFRLVNDQFCLITGYSKEELEQMDNRLISHPEDRDISASFISRALEFGEDRACFEKRYLHKDGRVIHCLVAISLVKNHEDESKFFIGHVQDITLLKAQAERINKDNEKLARLNELKDTFISIIGHDLRNPVGSIRMLSKIARTRMREGQPDQAAEMLDLLIDQSEQTYNLLSDLVEWAKIQSRETSFGQEDIRLPALFERELTVFKFQAADKKIRLQYHVEGDVEVAANYNMVRTVIRNLISNAIKFTFSGGVIRISAKGREDDVLICVEDSGRGIPDNMLEIIFCPFSRISTPGTAEERGMGFGLPMCKEFVDQHGGRLWAESQEGVGSRFYVTLPRRRERKSAAESAAEAGW
ncbi:MAG TPA: PAS domain S-box protein [Sphingobacteriaceae bacterium]